MCDPFSANLIFEEELDCIVGVGSVPNLVLAQAWALAGWAPWIVFEFGVLCEIRVPALGVLPMYSSYACFIKYFDAY